MPRRRRFLSVTGLWAMFTIGVASAIVGPSLPALVQEFAISWGHAGRLFAAQYGGKLLAVAIIWAGGRRLAAGAIAGIGGIVLATGLLLVGAVPSFGLVLAAVLLYGLGHGSLDVGCNSLLTQVLQPAPGERGTVTAGLNVLHLFFGIGALSGPVVVAVLQARTGSWRGAFVAAALCALLVPLGLLAAKGWGPLQPAQHPDANRKGAAKVERIILLAMAICFLYGGLETAIGGWVYTFLMQHAAFEPQVAAAGVTLYWSLLTAGRLLSAWGVRKLGDLIWLLALGGVLCLALGAGVVAGSRTGALMVTATGLGLSGIFPTMVGWVATRAGGSATKPIAQLVASSSLGAISIPWLAGLWVDWRGVFSAFGGLLLLAFLLESMLALAAWAERGGGRPMPAPLAGGERSLPR